jgi:hypothetical protein
LVIFIIVEEALIAYIKVYDIHTYYIFWKLCVQNHMEHEDGDNLLANRIESFLGRVWGDAYNISIHNQFIPSTPILGIHKQAI